MNRLFVSSLLVLAVAVPTHKTASPPVPPPPPVTATIDHAPLTSLLANPYISGTMQNSTGPIKLVLTTASDKKVVFQSAPAPISQGTWSVQVFPAVSAGIYQVDIYVGSTSVAHTMLTIGPKSLPRVELDPSLPAFDVSDGKLLHFSVQAGLGGPVGVAQFAFDFATTSLDITGVSVYPYADADYSQPLFSTSTDSTNAPVLVDPTNSSVVVSLSSPLEIPAGEKYYFEVAGTVSSSDSTYSVTTTLLGDPYITNPQSFDGLASSSNFVWSPNTYGTSAADDSDWTNGGLIAGLSPSSIRQLRTNSPSMDPPTCNVTVATTTNTLKPVTVSWTSTDATSTTLDNGAVGPASGSQSFATTSTTHTYILKAFGQYGVTTCYSTLAVARPVATTTTATTTTYKLDTFAASSTSGLSPFTTRFTGLVNASSSCAAATYTFSYGDGTVSSIVVAANSCKALSFNYSHTFSKVGLFSVGLYKGAFTGFATGTAQLVMKMNISSTNSSGKTSFLFDSLIQTANAVSAVSAETALLWREFLNWLPWKF